MANPIIGIDFGTTNCVVTKYEQGKTTVLPIKGKLTTPSVLYIEGSTVKVGHVAKQYITIHPRDAWLLQNVIWVQQLYIILWVRKSPQYWQLVSF